MTDQHSRTPPSYTSKFFLLARQDSSQNDQTIPPTHHQRRITNVHIRANETLTGRVTRFMERPPEGKYLNSQRDACRQQFNGFWRS
ncbi:hypothetical protein BaRGS_00020616 [Batillaria attramentaria]|uniref:Uncharacterized protein n=1 Tax=Batillaria attramentaria TaxID=370345 RepID=A0ABD0KLV6_9CAEN